MSAKTLDQCPPGASGRIQSLTGESWLVQRLMELGMVPGVEVRVVKLAPLGDPLQVAVRGYDLTLRRAEARAIVVDDDADES